MLHGYPVEQKLSDSIVCSDANLPARSAATFSMQHALHGTGTQYSISASPTPLILLAGAAISP